MGRYKPKLVCFSCKFGWGYLNGNGHEKDIEHLVAVMCSGKIGALQVIEAFRKGADGVLILGCPEGNCHFHNGNEQTRNRILLLQKTLRDFGIGPERMQIVLDMDPQGVKIPSAVQEMKARLQKLGPLSPAV